MKNSILSIALFSISISVGAQAYNAPESIEYDAANDRWLVANSGNGEIIARANDGTQTVFVSGMTSGPYGIEIVGNTVYACDGGRIKGYDLTTGTQVANVNLAASFLNGITHAGTDLFITDYSAKKIYRLNTLNNAFNVYVTGLAKSPNGIIYDADDNRLVFVNWGTNAPVMAVNMADSTTSTLTTTTLGNCDGIAMNCTGQFYVASWSPSSKISRFENDFVAAPVNMSVAGLSSPADIFYNTVEDTLGIPNSGSITVVFVHYTDCLAPNSIVENESFSFEFFPNPVAEYLTVNAVENNMIISINDAAGKLVFAKRAIGSICNINCSDFSNGIYFITVNGTTKKLFIQR